MSLLAYELIMKCIQIFTNNMYIYPYANECRCGGPSFDPVQDSTKRISRMRAHVQWPLLAVFDALWRSGNGIRHARADIRLSDIAHAQCTSYIRLNGHCACAMYVRACYDASLLQRSFPKGRGYSHRCSAHTGRTNIRST